jgi:hypothetical protein
MLGQAPPSCFQLEEEDDVHIAHNPLAFGENLEILKTALVLEDFVISTCLEHCEIIQGLPY